MLHRMIKWKVSTLLLVPLIAGLVLTGMPVRLGYAQDGLDPDAVRAFAKAKGLDSLRKAIQQDAMDGKGLPLLLGPDGNLNTKLKRNVPLPKNLQAFLNPKNKNSRLAAAQLGKALFWDMQIGSDGQSCASCHFHAGVDNRVKNQLNPDVKRIENVREGDIEGFHFAADAPDFELQIFPDHNYTFKAEDFPFVTDIGNGDNVLPGPGKKIIKPADGNTNDVASSMGVFWSRFQAVDPSGAVDDPNPGTTPDENIYNVFTLDSDVEPGATELRDRGEPEEDPAGFLVPATGGIFDGKVNVRRVEPRNTPTTINAVFNLHNFWDGRANFHFNGVTPHGRTDRAARIFVSVKNKIQARNIELPFASLASQAVGPPLSDFEMSFFGRIWPDIGKKMVVRYALAAQEVSPNDSLLGNLPKPSPTGKGLKLKYEDLIKQAFNPNLYSSGQVMMFPDAVVTNLNPDDPLQDLGDPVTLDAKKADDLVKKGVVKAGDLYTLMEANFSFFFGVAVMLYEAELVADDTPFDRFMATGEFNEKFNEDELLGLAVYVGFPGVSDGRCVNCHGGPEMTNVSIRNTAEGKDLIEPMFMGDGQPGFYDGGFYNIGVTPTAEDVGRGGRGPEDKPLASSRQFLFAEKSINGPINFPIIGEPIQDLVRGDCIDDDGDGVCDLKGNGEEPIEDTFVEDQYSNKLFKMDVLKGVQRHILVCIDGNMDGVCDVKNDEIKLLRAAVDGAFKTPGIRNQELQGPYMHNGGFKTLVEVVQFYDRGGNFCRLNFPDLDPDIEFIGLSEQEEEALVAFMIACTDERVRYEMAPFDRPELRIPNGHPGDETLTTADILFGNKQAKDEVLTLPAVGKDGVGENDKLKAFQVGLGLEDGLKGHLEFGEVESDVDGNTGEPKCNRPEQIPPQ